MRVAAIDCGTNSIRLLVAELDAERGLVEFDRRTTIVRLGEGVDANRKFSEAALDRTFRAVDDYAHAIRPHEVERIRFVATSASRDVSNRAEFEAGIAERLGVLPDVISGAEEADLSFMGATGDLPVDVPSPYLVIDIGGGSTEFVFGAASPKAAISVDMGCVRMTERYLQGDPPARDDIEAATDFIDQLVADAKASVPMAKAKTVIGLAGTVTTVAAMALGLSKYDRSAIHGSEFSKDTVHRVCRRLLEMTRDQRAALPFMHPGRVDVIGAGALVLDRVMHALPQQTLRVSEHDILDGIAMELARRA